MDPHRFAQIDRIFSAAVERRREKRSDFLDRACQGDAELRREVERLLAGDEDGTFLDRGLAPRAGTEEEAQDLEAGATLLHYRIVEKLGQGGMGEVYLAEDTKLGRRVALKVLPAETAVDSERFRRFRREARLEASLNHPGIVTVYSVEEAGGRAFLTLELVEGETLDSRLGEEGLETEELLDLAVQLADALAAAHSRGIVHRDLKPANLMIDGEGRLKVLDFGLAKLRPPVEGGDEAASTLALTTDGRVFGTVPYMSPEQLRGQAVDLRTDLFSFGAVLYEMATGRRPFRGRNTAELVSAILRDSPEPLRSVRPRLPRPLQGIVDRCLEKDPGKRFPSAAELRDDLRKVAEGEASGSRSDFLRLLPRPRLGALLAAVFLVALLLAAFYAGVDRWDERAPREPPAVAEAPGRASVAVLFFRNTAADEGLAWLRTGLTDILATDLSRSPELDVLATNRLYEIFHDLGAGEDEAPSSELLAELAERAGVDTVLEGSFLRNGEELRIQVKVRRARTGAIVTGERVAGRFETDLFSMVDGLSRSIRAHLGVPERAELAASVEEVTTSSLEAWRLYSEYCVLARLSRFEEAIASLEQAVEVDPHFALALAALGSVHEGLGHSTEAREYQRRAFELADRLPLRGRTKVQGAYYGSRWETLGRAIAVYENGLQIYPDQDSWLDHLARLYAFHERFEDAIRQYEKRIARGTDWPATYFETANAYAALGRPEEGYRILSGFADGHPDSWWLAYARGWYLADWGKLAEAEEAFRRAGELSPGNLLLSVGRWRLRLLQEDWPEAEAEASAMTRADDAYLRWRGAVSQARNLLFRGRSAEALEGFGRAAGAYDPPNAFTALARCFQAELLLARGAPAEALRQALLAQQEGEQEWPELRGLFLAALAQQELGRPAAADSILEELRQRWKEAPNRLEERQLHHLSGLLALARGGTETAVEELGRAASLLPPRGIEHHWHAYPEHVPIFFALGEAALAAGLDDEARRALERVTSSGSERLEQPVAYVRGFYLRGHLRMRRGEASEARRDFQRFLELWEGGDLDREHLQEALAYVAP